MHSTYMPKFLTKSVQYDMQYMEKEQNIRGSQHIVVFMYNEAQTVMRINYFLYHTLTL